MTLHAYNHNGTVYYLQRTANRDLYEIRVNPGKRSKLIGQIDSKSAWFEFVAGLKG